MVREAGRVEGVVVRPEVGQDGRGLDDFELAGYDEGDDVCPPEPRAPAGGQRAHATEIREADCAPPGHSRHPVVVRRERDGLLGLDDGLRRAEHPDAGARLQAGDDEAANLLRAPGQPVEIYAEGRPALRERSPDPVALGFGERLPRRDLALDPCAPGTEIRRRLDAAEAHAGAEDRHRRPSGTDDRRQGPASYDPRDFDSSVTPPIPCREHGSGGVLGMNAIPPERNPDMSRNSSAVQHDTSMRAVPGLMWTPWRDQPNTLHSLTSDGNKYVIT